MEMKFQKSQNIQTRQNSNHEEEGGLTLEIVTAFLSIIQAMSGGLMVVSLLGLLLALRASNPSAVLFGIALAVNGIIFLLGFPVKNFLKHKSLQGDKKEEYIQKREDEKNADTNK